MIDKAQDTVEEWRLVPLKMNVDTDVQVDLAELGFNAEVPLAKVRRLEEKEKEAKSQKELAEWVRTRKLSDAESVVEESGLAGKELAPSDHILANSPRKANQTSRSALASSRSSTRPLSVRIQEPNSFSPVNAAQAAAKKPSDIPSPSSASDPRSTTPPESSTARMTVVPSYDEPSASQIIMVDETAPPTNPFSDAFNGVPEVVSSAPPSSLIATNRTGVSDMSGSIGGDDTHRTAEGEDILKVSASESSE